MLLMQSRGEKFSSLHPLDETIDHLLLAGLFERDRQLVAIDLHHVAVAEFLVKHAIVECELRNRAGGFCHQLAFDHHRAVLVARETAAGLSATALAAVTVGLRALPAWRRVARAEGFDVVEARRAVAAAAAPA